MLSKICDSVLYRDYFLMFPLCYSIENGKFVLNDTENVVVENFVGIEKTKELLSEMEKLYEKSTFHDFFCFFNR